MSIETLTWQDVYELPFKTHPDASLRAVWTEHAMRDIWIKGASDPMFTAENIRLCDSRAELRAWFSFANWCNGTGFAIEAADGAVLCFIQMGECSGEWLTIKAAPTTFKGRPAWMSVAVDVISMDYLVERQPAKWDAYMDAFHTATLDECKSGAWYEKVKALNAS